MARLRTIFAGIAAIAMLCGTARAEGFLLGEESKGITIKAGEDRDLNLRIRLQPRFDAGDLIQSDEPTSSSYESETNF